ncbi:MAG: PKD domain-containing protein [Lewinellaceae bacterium]|nr:PKD domain-containing protein [Lewinellaceae bacterium]
MKNVYLSVLVLLFTSILASAQPAFRGTALTAPAQTALSQHFSEYHLFHIDAPALNQYAKEAPGAFKLELRLGETYQWAVELQGEDIRSEDYRLVSLTPRGEEVLPRSENKTFKGHVLGPLGGEARLTLDEHFIFGFVESNGETYYIEPARRFDPQLSEDTYLAYPSSGVAETNSFECGWHDTPAPDIHELPAPDAGRFVLACYTLDVALAADFSMVQQFGSVSGAESFMLGVLNNVQSNYDNEFAHQIIFEVATFFVSSCSSCDPWTSSPSAGALLDDFTAWGNSGGFGTNFDVASLWTDRNFSGNTIGIAWVGGLCTDGKYNALQNFSASSALLRVVQAHELGHNFNAGHDPQGTNFIMSPAVNNTNTWSTQSTAAINSYVNAFLSVPGCFTNCNFNLDPPTAGLTANITSGCVPMAVNFTDLSSGQVDDYSWQFPGGTPATSSSPNPVVTYNAAGTYDVILTVSNTAGFNTITMPGYIVVEDVPNPQFVYTTNSLTVQFDNLTTDAQSFSWDFGDGNVSDTPSPTHTFATDGFYTVTLTAFNACGVASVSEFFFVELPLQAGFISDGQTICAGMSVNFADQTTGTPAEWEWNFEGGAPSLSTLPNPTVTYNNPGVFDVSLTVTNPVGTFSTVTLQDYIEVLPVPEALFTYQVGPGGLTVQFNNFSTNLDSWLWDFGDGTSSTDENPSHTYATDGNYTVTLTAFGSCSDDIKTEEIVLATPPVAAFSADVPSGCAPLLVQFNNESSNNATSFEWHFQGGSPSSSNLANPSVNFNSGGIFAITLISSNAAGSDTITQNLAIEEGAQSAFTFDYTIGETQASFYSQATDADSIQWIFDDGTTSTQDTTTHDFGADGIYSAALAAFSNCGNDTLIQEIEIVTPPTADFELNASSGCAPFTVQASDLSSSNTTSWSWSAPGATPDTSSQQNPSFTYDTPGDYTITLEVENAAGTGTEAITITVGDIPQAAFSASVTLGQTGLSLTNNTTGADSYAWDFGDGNTSSETQPTHSYGQDGTYTVQLIATNTCGNDTTTQEVTVVTPPVADFDLNAFSGCAPFTVQVSDLSSSNTTSWSWSAPGATPDTSNEQNPSFTYDTPGDYTITLEVENAAGSGTEAVTITVGDIPQAAFSASVTLGQTGLSLTNNTTGADSYAWDFGDGNTSSETQPTHSYGQDGTYTVQLIATNTCGNDTTTQEVTVVTPPVADFDLNAFSGCAPFTVQVSDLSSSNTTSWSWSAPGATPDTSNEQNPSFTYDTPGDYTITLEVENAAGSGTEAVTITVGDIPQAAFSASVTLGQTGLSLTNNTTGADSYAWDFGDGNTSSETQPTHSYGQDGTYTVQLIATNTCGNDTTTQEVTVVTPPVADFDLNAFSGCAPFTVQVSDLSSSNTTSWSWSAPGATPDTSNEQNPSFTYDTPGDYTITLEVSNAAGTGTETIEVFVNIGPDPGFMALVNGLEAQFINTSANSQAYEWDFGDGNGSEEAGPVHSYDTPGDYLVTLSAMNECGTATITDTITLNLAAPVANFTVSGNEGCAPLTVTFQNNSENADSYSWSFPGGTPSTSTAPNPTVTYETPGAFSVTLMAINAAGSGALTRQNIIVVGGPPQGGFEYATNEATVAFNNTTENADSYLWMFGDGHTSTETSPEHTYSQGGDYTVMLLAYNECGTDTTQQSINLTGMAPSPGLSASIESGCAPLTVTFGDGAEGTVTSWQWSFPGGNPASSSDPNPTVVYEQPGVYDVTLTIGNAFGENSQNETALITVIGVPEASFSPEIQGLGLTLTNTSSGEGLSYEWDFGDGTGSTEENPEHAYAEPGEYAVVLTVSNECGTDTARATVRAVVSGLADESWLEAFTVFPNPGSGPFTVRLQGQPAARLQLNLLNVVGQRIFRLEDSFLAGYWQGPLELERLPAGVYVLEARAGEQRAYRKVVVE